MDDGVTDSKELSEEETITFWEEESGANFIRTHSTLWKKQTMGVLKQEAM